jgi:aminomethyltransferase
VVFGGVSERAGSVEFSVIPEVATAVRAGSVFRKKLSIAEAEGRPHRDRTSSSPASCVTRSTALLVHRQTVLLGRSAPYADCDYRAVAHSVHDDLARFSRAESFDSLSCDVVVSFPDSDRLIPFRTQLVGRMTVIEGQQDDLGATWTEVGGRRIPDHYGRPERAHGAVRNVVGVTEMPNGVVVVRGDDRVEYVDNVVSNRVPTDDGEGVYALLLDPQGGVELDLYVYNAGEQLLLFVPPGEAEPLAEEWREKVFIQDVEIEVASDGFAVFGVHGPKATEKIASVLNGASSPERHLSFVRGRMAEVGVTVVRTDAPTGEEGFEVVCTTGTTVNETGVERENAELVFDTLLNQGLNAAPFGRRTWGSLTLEAGTPLFETELAGRIPNVLGIRNAVDFEKGCFVGQEVVSRVENRGQPSQRLVGLVPEAVPGDGAAVFAGERSEPASSSDSENPTVFAGEEAVGEVTRGVESPTREEPIAFAVVDFEVEASDVTVRVGGEEVPAEITDLPFVEGSDRSGRIPEY